MERENPKRNEELKYPMCSGVKPKLSAADPKIRGPILKGSELAADRQPAAITIQRIFLFPIMYALFLVIFYEQTLCLLVNLLPAGKQPLS